MAWIVGWLSYMTIFIALAHAKDPVLKVTSILTEPYLSKSTDANGNVSYYGYIPDLLEEIRNIYPFDYTFEIQQMYGTRDVNNTWVGAIGDIVNGESDLAACPLTITSKRMKAVQFSIPFQRTNLGIVRLVPEPSESFDSRFLRIYRPFESSVWLLVAVSFFATGMVVYIISRFNPYEWRRMVHDREATIREGESFTCPNSFWFIISASTLQGYIQSPRSIGGRIVVMTFWWFILLVISCYIANLSNLFRVPSEGIIRPLTPIKSLVDLVNSNIEIAVIKGSYTERQIQDMSQISQIGRLKVKLEGDKGRQVASVGEGLDFVRNKDGAFITDVNLFSHIMACDLYITQDPIITIQYGLAFPYSSSHFHPINKAIMEIAESGKLHTLEKKWMTKSCMRYFDGTETDSFPGFYAVTLNQISGAVLPLAAGIVLGLLITMFEVLIYRCAEVDHEKETKNDVQMKKPKERTDKTTDPLLTKSSEATNV